MNLSHDALEDLNALAVLKAEGGILERHFLLLKGHVINDHRRVDVSSLEGLRMALRVKRIGALTEEEHARDIDSKVAQILRQSDCVQVAAPSTASRPPLQIGGQRG